MRKIIISIGMSIGALVLLCGCQPTVQIKAPKDPITINLNVKIQHEIRVRVDKQLDDLFKKDKSIF